MSSFPPPVFGKRNTGSATPRAAPASRAVEPVPEHAAFFAAMRTKTEDEESAARTVPRSFRAAILAGLFVGFGLAGFDVTRANETIRGLAGLTPDPALTSKLVPVIVLLGLVGGARAAATNLLIAHSLLGRFKVTGHGAYAAAGATVAAGFAALAALVIQSGPIDATPVPTHGWTVDIAAGAAAGFLYRVFAGSRKAG